MSDSNTAVSTAVRDSTIYVAVEVSRSSWVVALHCPETGGKVGVHTVKPSDTDALVQLIERARVGVSRAEGVEPRVVLTYEAGYEGFWLARDLARRDPGIAVYINDPASLQVNRRSKKAKTDRIDVRKMVRALKAWDLGDAEAMAWVRIPSVGQEDSRRLLREREALIGERIRLGNRILSLLKLHGIFGLSAYSTTFLDELAAVRTGYGTALPTRARAEVERAVERLRLVQSQIAVLDAEKTRLVKAGRNAVGTGVDAMMARLVRLRGIGNNDAVLLATEVFCRDFRNRRELGGWSGLASVPWSSGCVDHDQGISKAGPSHVRKHLIQMAWRWLQYQPNSELSQWYRNRLGTDRPANRRLRKRLAVALARKLLIALWCYATLERVPAGAILH